MADKEDLYGILQVEAKAFPEVIEGAYRALAYLYHPDRNAAPEAREVQARIERAYETLSDPVKRRQYDRQKFRKGLMQAIGLKRSSAIRIAVFLVPLAILLGFYANTFRGLGDLTSGGLLSGELDLGLPNYSEILAELTPSPVPPATPTPTPTSTSTPVTVP